MTFSYVYRPALIGLLPLIALILYVEGQRYDPALIRFEQTPSDKSSISLLLPEAIDTLNRLGNVRLYSKDNLYEYVNGHAEYFISAGFVSLAVGEYGASDPSVAEPDVIIDIYDMEKSIQAFGVISDESRGNLSDIAGLTSFMSPSGISFSSGRYYVKLSAYSDTVPVEDIALRISALIGQASDPFPEFSKLPHIGPVTATRFIREAYRGLDFLNNVIEREYAVDGSSVQVFVVTKETGGIATVADAFLTYFNQSKVSFTSIKRGSSTVYSISDPYEGDWSMIVSPDSLIGVFGELQQSVVHQLLGENNRVKSDG